MQSKSPRTVSMAMCLLWHCSAIWWAWSGRATSSFWRHRCVPPATPKLAPWATTWPPLRPLTQQALVYFYVRALVSIPVTPRRSHLQDFAYCSRFCCRPSMRTRFALKMASWAALHHRHTWARLPYVAQSPPHCSQCPVMGKLFLDRSRPRLQNSL